MLFSCINQTPKNDIGKWKLKGNVKYIQEINYSLSGKNKTELEFNPFGNVVIQTSLNSDGSLIRKWVFEYDKENNPIKKNCFVMNDSLSTTLYFQYNKAGKLIQSYVVKSDGIKIAQTELKYDDNKNLKEEVNYGIDNKIETKISYKYNKKNQVIEEIHADSANHQNWKRQYIYNNKELKTEIIDKTMSDSILSKQINSYDDSDRINELKLLDGHNQLILTTSYKYDSFGNKLEIVKTPNNTTTQEKRTYEYKYDKFGNYIFFVEYINDVLETTITRDIIYFGSN